MLTARSAAHPVNAPLADTVEESVAEPSTLQISSRALGDIEVSSKWVMHFPTPLGGFPSHQNFVLIPAAREGLWWLQALDDSDVTFILGDPFLLEASYSFDLGDVERDMLSIKDEGDAFGLVMLTLPQRDGESATANCRAPIVFNLTQRIGMQVLTRDDTHDMRRPLDLSVYKPQALGLRMQ